MINLDIIISNIKKSQNLKYNKDVAHLLGLSAADFSLRKKRGSLLIVIVQWAVKKNINLDWLLTGKNDDFKNTSEDPTYLFEKETALKFSEFRKKSSLSQSEMALKLEIDTETYRHYENTGKDIPLIIARKLGNMGADLKWLLGIQNMESHDFSLKNSSGNSKNFSSKIILMEKNYLRIINEFKDKEKALDLNKKLVEIEAISKETFKKVADHIGIVFDTAKTISGEYNAAKEVTAKKTKNLKS